MSSRILIAVLALFIIMPILGGYVQFSTWRNYLEMSILIYDSQLHQRAKLQIIVNSKV